MKTLQTLALVVSGLTSQAHAAEITRTPGLKTLTIRDVICRQDNPAFDWRTAVRLIEKKNGKFAFQMEAYTNDIASIDDIVFGEPLLDQLTCKTNAATLAVSCRNANGDTLETEVIDGLNNRRYVKFVSNQDINYPYSFDKADCRVR